MQLSMFMINTKNMSPGRRRAIRFLVLYIVWLICGTIFYAWAPQSDLGLVMGFFMAINIGYSIGFGFPTEGFTNYLIFSSVYVIIGASFVAMALSFFADKISEDHDNWFTNLMQKQNYDDAFKKGTSCLDKIKAVFIQYSAPIRAVSLWAAWIIAMALYAGVVVEDWDWKQAQYFAISTCSTGGHYGLPPDAPIWLFGLTAFMMLLGVPVMAVAMASMASLFVDQGDLDSTKDMICEEVDIKELVMLQKFGLENGDGVIDRAEFIILCMVRMGTDPNLIEFISDRFAELDEDGGGTLSIHEITRGKYDIVDGQIRPTEKKLSELRAKSKRAIGFKSMRNFSVGSGSDVGTGLDIGGFGTDSRDGGETGYVISSSDGGGSFSGAPGGGASADSGAKSSDTSPPANVTVQKTNQSEPPPVTGFARQPPPRGPPQQQASAPPKQQQQQQQEQQPPQQFPPQQEPPQQRQQQPYPPPPQQQYAPQRPRPQYPPRGGGGGGGGQYPPPQQQRGGPYNAPPPRGGPPPRGPPPPYQQQQPYPPQYNQRPPPPRYHDEQQQLLDHQQQAPPPMDGGYQDGGYQDGYQYPDQGGYQDGGYQDGGYQDGGYQDDGYQDGYQGGPYQGQYQDGGYQDGGPYQDGYQDGYQDYHQNGGYPDYQDDGMDTSKPSQANSLQYSTTQVTQSTSSTEHSNVEHTYDDDGGGGTNNESKEEDEYGTGGGILQSPDRGGNGGGGGARPYG